MARINAHDEVGLMALAGPSLRFIDALGDVYALTGEGWRSYFDMFPDYRIEVDGLIESAGTVAVFGIASGSYRGRRKRGVEGYWRIPTAWKAVVRGARVSEWRVFCDIEPMLRSAGRGRFQS